MGDTSACVAAATAAATAPGLAMVPLVTEAGSAASLRVARPGR